jgi:type III pantothenate kinase
MNMLLAVDVGNTDTVVGLFQGPELVHDWRLTSLAHRSGDELAVLYHSLLGSVELAPGRIEGMAVSSVVPELTPAYRRLAERMFGREPLIIDHRAVPELRILNHDPATVGSDRLVNAVAVVEGYGAPAIVVDLGTATTLDVIGGEGEYVGGVIAPGISSSANALFQRGARLSRVEIKRPEKVVGRSTEESMQSGIFFGVVGSVDTLVRMVIRERGFEPGIPVVATGGLAPAIQDASETITAVDQTLTLTGIRLIWERRR